MNVTSNRAPLIFFFAYVFTCETFKHVEELSPTPGPAGVLGSPETPQTRSLKIRSPVFVSIPTPTSPRPSTLCYTVCDHASYRVGSLTRAGPLFVAPPQRRRRLEDRRDSFHFLQKAVEGRAQQKASRNPGTNDSQAVSPGPLAWGVPWEGMAGVGEFERREAREPRNPRSGGEERFFAAAERAWGSSLG